MIKFIIITSICTLIFLRIRRLIIKDNEDVYIDVERFKKRNQQHYYNVAQRRFFIWKLELWWIAFDSPQFYPEGRNHLKGNWFWRKKH